MVIDVGAVLAVFLREAGARAMIEVIADAPVRRMPAAGWLKCAIRPDAAEGGSHDLEGFVRDTGIAVGATTPEHARPARQAHRRFGMGRHRARPNLGDRLAHALAAERGEAPLFEGGDLALTDITPALPDGGGDR